MDKGLSWEVAIAAGGNYPIENLKKERKGFQDETLEL
jgi:hypothetical protein